MWEIYVSKKMVTATSIPLKFVHTRCVMVMKTLNVKIHPTRQNIPDHVSTTGLHMCWSVRKGQGKHTRWFILLWVGDIQTFVKLVSQLCPCFAKKNQSLCRWVWFNNNSVETELACAVHVIMVWAKRIYILVVKVNKLFFFFLLKCFLKEIENMYSLYLLSYRNTRKSLGELQKAVETLAYGSCSPSIFILDFYGW